MYCRKQHSLHCSWRMVNIVDSTIPIFPASVRLSSALGSILQGLKMLLTTVSMGTRITAIYRSYHSMKLEILLSKVDSILRKIGILLSIVIASYEGKK